MEWWRLALIGALVAALIPTLALMRQVNALKERGDSAECRKKQRLLTWCIRLLILIFVLTLGTTMYQHYAAIAAMS